MNSRESVMGAQADPAEPLYAVASRSIGDEDLVPCVARFEAPDLGISLGQIVTSIGGYLAVCAAMYAAAGISYGFVLLLAPVAAGFLVRTFIIQHDCGHGAYFRSWRWNQALGIACSLMTLAPYLSWRRQHAGHHRVWNNLDSRDSGADIYSYCLTVEEYRALSPWRRRWYRLTRNAVVANLILPPLVFLVLYRLPFDMPARWRRERRGVHLTNLALVAFYGTVGMAAGFDRLIQVQLPVLVLASIIGVWLFTVQHRSDRTVWAREAEWTPQSAAVEGSTYLRLPRPLQWFTGNIGLHHVHHLNSTIPNYGLQQAHDALREFCTIPAMPLGKAFRALFYVLWDERRRRLVTFGEAGSTAP